MQSRDYIYLSCFSWGKYNLLGILRIKICEANCIDKIITSSLL